MFTHKRTMTFRRNAVHSSPETTNPRTFGQFVMQFTRRSCQYVQ